MNERLTIGKLAKIAGVRIDTVRFYEQKGLIPRGVRRQTSFREYNLDDAKKIRFIKRAQELGFALAEIRELLELKISARGTCARVKAKTDLKLVEINQKIKDLKAMRSTLEQLSKQCSNDSQPTSKCPILNSFDKETDENHSKGERK